MGKRSRVKARSVEPAAGEVGPRQPCPCGSGRRYKACHGSPDGSAVAFNPRPFAGMSAECDLIAVREFVPAATAPLRLKGEHADRKVLLCSLLPGAVPALVRADGTVWLGLQVQHGYGDPSRDLAAVLSAALEAEPDQMVGLTADPGQGPGLADLIEDDITFTVQDGFDFWVSDVDDPNLSGFLEQANSAISPTVRLDGVRAAYWTSLGDREFLRWVRPEDEDALLDALARLHVTGQDRLIEAARLIGMFRAHGVLVPVWEFPVGTGAEALAGPVAAFDELLTATLADVRGLEPEERSARAGLASRQLTIR